MTNIKAIIIDDECLARDLVRKYLESFKQIEIIAEFEDGFNGLKGINELKPDLVFLDIQMPKLTGLEMLELIDTMPHIIFTTAYDQHAIKAFELNAVDYLLKPFSKERFGQALSKVFEKHQVGQYSSNINELKNGIEQTATLDKIVVKDHSHIHVIALEDIVYIASEDDYVMIHTKDRKYLKNKTMKFYETHLDKTNFARIHRSYIVNLNYINKIEKYGKDSYQVELQTGDKLNISRSRYQDLKSILNF